MGGGQRRARHEYELCRPRGSDMHRMLAAAAEKGLVLIAAAGNAGPIRRRFIRRPTPT